MGPRHVFYCKLPVSPIPIRKVLIPIALSLTVCLAATIEVGGGAPTTGLTGRFVNAFYRNGFAYLVSLPPIDNVQRFGTVGLIQEFNPAGSTGAGAMGTGARLALIKANMTTALPTDGSVDVAQVLANMNSYYGSVGVTTAGFPTTDTLTCPSQMGLPPCEYQFFNKKYVLFTYDSSTFNGSNFAVRDPFYTKWIALGDINGLGPAIDIERNVTGQKSVAATVQLYASGAIYNITSGAQSGNAFAVMAPVYAAYVAYGGDQGFLGLPISNDLVLTGGGHRQSFQGGNLDYSYTGGLASVPVLALPVASVSVQPSFAGAYQMKQGDTLALHANLFTSSGANLTGRLVTWVSTNSRVVSISATSGSPDAVATAIGQGTALVSAISEGLSSPSLTITVNSVCCQIGEGASPAAQQAMLAAVTRNQLLIQLPVKAPAQRVAAGYVQQLLSTGTPAASYLLAKSDASPTAYMVTGAALDRYTQLGGAAGSLGYPVIRWHGIGTPVVPERGAGGKSGAPGNRGHSGEVESAQFRGGAGWLAYGRGECDCGVDWKQGAAADVRQGDYFRRDQRSARGTGATGVGLDTRALHGHRRRERRVRASGERCVRTGWPHASGFRRRLHRLRPGRQCGDRAWGAAASADQYDSSGGVVAGSRLRLSVNGFADGSTLRVSISGQQDFVVTTVNGSYTWDAFIPLSAPSQTILVHAVDTSDGTAADGSYTVKSLTESQLQLAATQGASQTGAPGAQLAQTLRVQLTDSNGTAVIGAAVTFAASSGGQIVSSTGVTDSAGQAEAAVRLPASEGLALFTATAGRLVATFSARAAAMSLTKFPTFLQSDAPYGSTVLGRGTATVAQKGALLTAAAGILGYYVNRGDLAGAAVDPGSLNQYLQKLCITGTDGSQLCDGFLTNPDSGEQVVNLWRIGGLEGGNLDVAAVAPELVVVRDLVASGSPVLLALALTANGAQAGGHYVVATGVAADGSILIHDPSADFGRSNLNDYLAGFAAGGIRGRRR